MNKIIIIFIFTVLVNTTFSQENNFSYNYHSDIGDYYLYKKDTLKAIKIFDSIYSLYPNFSYPNSKLLYDVGRRKEALVTYEKLCKSGISKQFFKEYYEYNDMSSPEKESIDDAFNYFENNKDIRKCKFIDSLLAIDQKVRIETDYTLTESEIIAQQEKVDRIIFNSLYNEIKLNGWPTNQEIGIKGYIIIDILILHGMRYYSEDEEIFQFFHYELKKKINTGEYWSLAYAQNYDEYLEWVKHEGQYYASFLDENNLIHTKYSITEINTHRKSIGLGPIEQYLEMKGAKIVRTKK